DNASGDRERSLDRLLGRPVSRCERQAVARLPVDRRANRPGRTAVRGDRAGKPTGIAVADALPPALLVPRAVRVAPALDTALEIRAIDVAPAGAGLVFEALSQLAFLARDAEGNDAGPIAADGAVHAALEQAVLRAAHHRPGRPHQIALARRVADGFFWRHQRLPRVGDADVVHTDVAGLADVRAPTPAAGLASLSANGKIAGAVHADELLAIRPLLAGIAWGTLASELAARAFGSWILVEVAARSREGRKQQCQPRRNSRVGLRGLQSE